LVSDPYARDHAILVGSSSWHQVNGRPAHQHRHFGRKRQQIGPVARIVRCAPVVVLPWLGILSHWLQICEKDSCGRFGLRALRAAGVNGTGHLQLLSVQARIPARTWVVSATLLSAHREPFELFCRLQCASTSLSCRGLFAFLFLGASVFGHHCSRLALSLPRKLEAIPAYILVWQGPAGCQNSLS